MVEVVAPRWIALVHFVVAKAIFSIYRWVHVVGSAHWLVVKRTVVVMAVVGLIVVIRVARRATGGCRVKAAR